MKNLLIITLAFVLFTISYTKADFPSVPAQQFYVSWIFSGQVFQEDRLFSGRDLVDDWSDILEINLSWNTLNCFYDVNWTQPKLAYKLWWQIIYWSTLFSDQDTRCIYPIQYIEDSFWNKDYWSVYQSWFLWWSSWLANADWTHYFKINWLNNIDFYYESTPASSFTWMTFEESFVVLNTLLSWYINSPKPLNYDITSFTTFDQTNTDLLIDSIINIFWYLVVVLSVAFILFLINRLLNKTIS